MAKTFYNIRPSGGGGGGAVDSVNGQTGNVIITKSSVGLGNVNNTSDANKPISIATQAALDNKQDIISGNPYKALRLDNVGNPASVEQLEIYDSGYTQYNVGISPDGNAGGFDVNRENIVIQPLQDSPDESWVSRDRQVNSDPGSSGFAFGTGGQAFRFDINNYNHQGSGDLGAIEFVQNNFSIGNGTDPIEFRGMGYSFGFGNINANVNVTGPLQGYGFQPQLDASASIDPSTYIQAFYDAANINCDGTSYYTSFNASPSIARIISNHNYNAFNANPSIPLIDSNSGVVGIGLYGNYGTFSPNSYYQAININPNITSARYAVGINVSMDNVNVFPGVQSSAVIQDLTIAADQPGSQGDTVSVEYIGGGTAGSEIVSVMGLAYTVQIEDGVSTAQNIADALNAFPQFTMNANVTISGTASNPQTIQGPTNLAGGQNAGTKQAAYLDGDVEITGSLSFGGALSIGRLNAFAAYNVVDGGGTPGSVHTIIDQMNVPASASIANADTLGVNTAALINVGAGATVTSAFLGLTALGLPAVASLGAGATVDRITGATFALSLDATAGGGTINEVALCKSLAIPNGVTTVNRLYGYAMDLPFGDPGTNSWGVYIVPAIHNYMAGALKIGGTDTEHASAALEVESTTRGFLNARMTTTQRDTISAVNGLQIYNTTTDKLQVYAAGSWVDLH